MKPNFALNLSHDGISLLHRNEGSKLGWSLVGEVALDDPEMTDKLEMLRKTAAGLDQSGVATKLVIPASQILFTEVTTNAADDISREVQIREALEGLTPYEVGELVFDWRRAKGKAVKVAVVARETLQEAESFARDHRFNPVSFVTRGQQGFRGEAFFGMAAGAAAFLGAGVHVDADQKSIPKIAALRPQDPEEPDNAAAPKADETAKLAPTSTPDLHEAEQQEDLSAQEKPAAVDQPASKDAPDTATPAVEADEKAPETAQTPPPLADEASPEASDEDARIAALLAEVPEPAQEGPGDLNGTATPETPARKEAQPEESKAKATPKKKSAATPPPKPAAVLAPFPPSLDVEDTPRPAATPRPKTAAKPSAKPAKPVAKPKPPVAAKPEVKSSIDEKPPAETRAETKPAPKAPVKAGDRPAPPPPRRRQIPPLAGAQAPSSQSASMPPAAGPSTPPLDRSRLAARTNGTAPHAPIAPTAKAAKPPAANPDKPAGPAPAFASRRREDPSGSAKEADLSAPGAVVTDSPDKPLTAGKPPVPPRTNGARAPLRAEQSTVLPPSPPVTSGVTGAQTPDMGQEDGGPSNTGARLARAASVASKAAKGLMNRRKAATDSAPSPSPKAAKAAEAKPAPSAAKSRKLRIPGIGGGSDANKPGAPIGTPQKAASPKAAPTAIAPAPGAAQAPLLPGKRPDAETLTSEAERLTMFGARRSQREEVGGKPKYLGLVLTLVLLLAMAVIALGSVFLFGETDTAGTAPNGGGDFAAASVPSALLPSPADETGASLTPAPEAPVVAPGANGLATPPDSAQSPAGPEISTTPIAPPAEPVDTAQAPPEQPEPPRSPEVLSEDAAQTRYAATGIWEKAPTSPSEPQSSRIDDLYIASIDPEVSGHDPVSLPPVGNSSTDARPSASLPPAAPGTDFALNEEGLVAPSPEGTLSPAGILVYSGKPPVDAPVRPGTVRPQILPDSQLRGFRPKPRPTGLIEETQRANNGGNTLLELAALRPNPRPEELAARAVAEAGADNAAVEDAVAAVIAEGELVNVTGEAVAASPQPGHRPGDFATIVASARANIDASDGSTVVAASAAPTSSPSIPTRANVATQATVKNALRLNQMNLIGIYGSSSSRRALIRLKTGRYTKVSVGDRLNGGKVVSITENRLIYTKNGRNVTLELLPLG